ncbi:MAG: IS5 family transposase [Methyloligellaceae bacterium]
MAKRYELSDQQWQQICELVPGKAGDPGRSGRDNRLFVNGVLWVLRSGAHWHDLPPRYGKWKSVHKRFTRWAEAGVWERIFATLTADPDNDYLMLDSTLVRAHQQAANRKRGDRNQALGRSRGGLTTKIHLAADARGRPLRVLLTPGQAGDAPQAPALLEGLRPTHVIADKAYDSNAIRALIAAAGANAVIPCNPTRKRLIPYDFQIYKARNRIERCFNKLKHFRRIATRYDRRAVYFLAFIHIACSMLWMR